MRRFTVVAGMYILICALAIAVIVIRGDGPHPRVVTLFPTNGYAYFPGGQAEITFSQPMDHSTVERALDVSPGSQGQGAWFGNTLNLQPIGDWRQNTNYRVTLNGTVTDDLGRPLSTPFVFHFRVHRIGSVGLCLAHGRRSICETTPGYRRDLLPPGGPVLQYALSGDGSLLAFTRRNTTQPPHLFVLDLTTGTTSQLTYGTRYADSSPIWAPGDTSSVTYDRRPIIHKGDAIELGPPQLWNVNVDGSGNLRLH